MRIAAIAVVVLFVVFFALVVGLTQIFDKGSPNRETSKSVNLLLNDLEKVQGKRLAVDGDVKTKVAPWAVLLGSSDATQTGVLVVSKKPLASGVHQAAHVHATGVATRFSLAAFRRTHPQLSNAAIQRSPIRDLNGQPALVNATVALSVPPAG
jgi:hypothetical protein